MPIYEYHCVSCGEDFEELVSVNKSELPQCPLCSSRETQKKVSLFGSFGGSSCTSSGSSSGFT